MQQLPSIRVSAGKMAASKTVSASCCNGSSCNERDVLNIRIIYKRMYFSNKFLLYYLTISKKILTLYIKIGSQCSDGPSRIRAGMTVSLMSSKVLHAGGARGEASGGIGLPIILGATRQCLK